MNEIRQTPDMLFDILQKTFPDLFGLLITSTWIQDLIDYSLDQVASFLHFACEDELIDELVGIQVVLCHDAFALEYQMQLGIVRCKESVIDVCLQIPPPRLKICLLQHVIVTQLADLPLKLLKLLHFLIMVSLGELCDILSEIIVIDLLLLVKIVGVGFEVTDEIINGRYIILPDEIEKILNVSPHEGLLLSLLK